MHPTDAEARGVRHGDRVRAFNRAARLCSRLAWMARCLREWWPPGSIGRDSAPAVGNINVLTSEKLTDMGNAATFYSVSVEVELFRA